MADRVVVTGGSGWIGSNVVSRLTADGIDVVSLGSSDGDLSDAQVVHDLFAQFEPARVVHLASSLARGNSREAFEAQWQNTVQLGRNVLDVARERGTHVIAAGSFEEFGDVEGVLTADSVARPKTAYGIAKSLVRELAAYQSSQGLAVDWFRPTTVYGPGQKGSMLIPSALTGAASGLPTNFTDGSQERDFIYIDDLVDWISRAVHAPAPAKGSFAIHHLGRGEGVPVREVLELIASQFERADFKLGAVPRREHEPDLQAAGSYADPLQRFEWSAEVDWREGVARTAAWLKAAAS